MFVKFYRNVFKGNKVFKPTRVFTELASIVVSMLYLKEMKSEEDVKWERVHVSSIQNILENPIPAKVSLEDYTSVKKTQRHLFRRTKSFK